MTKFQLIHSNSLGLEIARLDVQADDQGPLMLATVAQSVDVRSTLEVLEPGDRLELVEIQSAELEPIDPAYRLWDELPPFERTIWNGEGKERTLEPATPGKVRWSQDREPPAIGARIYANMNDLGPAIVTHYVTIDGFLGVNAKLEAAPAWHKRQRKGDPNGCLFGPEFEPLDDATAAAKIAALVKRKRDAIAERDQTAERRSRERIQERINRLDEILEALVA